MLFEAVSPFRKKQQKFKTVDGRRSGSDSEQFLSCLLPLSLLTVLISERPLRWQGSRISTASCKFRNECKQSAENGRKSVTDMILVTLTSSSDSNFERSNINLKENIPDDVDPNSNGHVYCIRKNERKILWFSADCKVLRSFILMFMYDADFLFVSRPFDMRKFKEELRLFLQCHFFMTHFSQRKP